MEPCLHGIQYQKDACIKAGLIKSRTNPGIAKKRSSKAHCDRTESNQLARQETLTVQFCPDGEISRIGSAESKFQVRQTPRFLTFMRTSPENDGSQKYDI